MPDAAGTAPRRRRLQRPHDGDLCRGAAGDPADPSRQGQGHTRRSSPENPPPPRWLERRLMRRPRRGGRSTVVGAVRDSGPVLTAPVSAVPALFVTVRARPGPFCPVKTASSAAGGGFDGTKRAGTRSDGRRQGRNSADGCGEDRATGGVLTAIPQITADCTADITCRWIGRLWRSSCGQISSGGSRLALRAEK